MAVLMPMTVTANDAWRTPVNVTPAFWKRTILNAGGPTELASQAGYDAAYPLTALALAMLKRESSYATDFDANPATNKNPWNLKSQSYDGTYVKYATWPDGAKGWRERITSTTYKDGVYARTVTYANLINTYAPPSENQTNAYLAGVLSLINGYELIDPPVTTPSTPPEPIPGEGAPMAELVYGRVPKPPMKVMIVPKGASGQTGWFQTAPRHNVGFMAHETQGTGSGEWYFQFFSCPAGERCGDALVDFLIDQQGVIYMYNDPEGTRAPWANGGGALSSGGLEGDGIAYVNYFGLGAVDTKTISCEIVKTKGAAMKPAQIVSLGKLFAYYADRDKQPWQNWPAIAKYAGTRVYLNHWEVGTTNCSINPDDNDRVIAEVQKNLKAAQQDGVTPAPAPTYVDPDPPQAGTFVKNDRLFLAVGIDYTLTKAIKPYKYADFKPEQQTGPELPKGTKVKVTHVVSDTGETSDLTLVLDAVKVGDYQIKPGSRIDGKAVA